MKSRVLTEVRAEIWLNALGTWSLNRISALTAIKGNGWHNDNVEGFALAARTPAGETKRWTRRQATRLASVAITAANGRLLLWPLEERHSLHGGSF